MRARFPPAVALALILAGCSGPLPPAVDLAIAVDPRCTTCEDFIRCSADSGNAAVYDPAFHLYHLRPKSTFAQIATILDYPLDLFRERREDRRPLMVYVQSAKNFQTVDRSITVNGVAVTDLTNHRIQVPDGWIDQVTGDWYGTDDARKGRCGILPRPEGRELATLFPAS